MSYYTRLALPLLIDRKLDKMYKKIFRHWTTDSTGNEPRNAVSPISIYKNELYFYTPLTTVYRTTNN